MRVRIKTVQELIDNGFTTDKEGNLKKNCVFVGIDDSSGYLGTWQDAVSYKDERIQLANGFWIPISLLATELDLKYYKMAETLGLTLGKPFVIMEFKDRVFKVELDGIFEYVNSKWCYVPESLDIARGILLKDYNIADDKWKPTLGKEYYYYDKKVKRAEWNNTFQDYLNFSMFNCFPYRVLAQLYGKAMVDMNRSDLAYNYRCSSGLYLFPGVLQNE